MKKDETRFTMRIDNKLWAKIKILAEKSKRSAVKEIEYIFDLLFGNSSDDELVKHFDELERLIKEAEKMEQTPESDVQQNEKSA